MKQTPTSYTKTAIVLHWLIAIFIALMFVLGWYMAELPKEAPKQMAYDLFDLGIYTWQVSEEVSPRTFYFNLHKSLGLTVLALIVFRILWRITHTPPAALSSYKAIEKKVAKATHHSLYLLMLAVPVTGLTMAINSKYGVKWFGIDVIAGLDNKPLRDFFECTHEFVGIVLLVFIGIHLLGALKHKFIDKDDTMSRMSLK
ncbi:CybB Cytochrome B561 [Methylophilaceae bacterium]